jgi:sporulation protein YqfC
VKQVAKSRLRRVAQELDIPYDLIDGTPRITAWGNERLWIENHTGILEYSPKRARFNSDLGEIVVAGEGFVFEYNGSGSACISGKIASVALLEAADAF